MLSIYIPMENIPDVTVEVSYRSSLRSDRVLTNIILALKELINRYGIRESFIICPPADPMCRSARIPLFLRILIINDKK